MQLTAADRMPERGDVLSRPGSSMEWVVQSCREQDGHIIVERVGDTAQYAISPRRQEGMEYVSRADGGPITKGGE